jgi:hypothetical protein
MKCITASKAADWWRDHYQFVSLPQDCRQWPAEQTVCTHIDFDTLPAANLSPLARAIIGWLCDDSPDRLIVWVDEWGVWPSSEDWNLYYALRTSFGDRGFIEDGPAHVFYFHERHAAQSLVALAIAFGWGVYIGPSRGRQAIRFDHDGRFYAWADHEHDRKSLREFLGSWLKDNPGASGG